MKNRTRLGMMPSLIAAMLVLSLFSGVVAAQSPAEQYEKDKEQYKQITEKYENTKKKFEDAKDRFEKVRERLRNLNESDELKLKAKDYLVSLIDHTVAHLEVLKYRVELRENKGIIPFDASRNIDDHIAQLGKIKANVQSATTYRELIAAHSELKEIWVKIRLETRYYVGIVLNYRIDQFITKTDNVTVRMDAAIQRLKDKGIDTKELENDEARFKELVQEATTNQEKTVEMFNTHSGFANDGTVTDAKAAREFLLQADKSQRSTIKSLKDASKQVLEFVRDFRKLSRGEVKIEGGATSTLSGN
ncbi:MAG TPA: hypothetical protein VJJ51_03980 [Candidatus Methanoperedens sp.]|nr:hypothetical protein [Candidatus Methanoperedens sp.]